MIQVTDKEKTDPILVDLSNRYAEEYRSYQKSLKKVNYEYNKSRRLLNRELRTLVGLKPGDKIIYEGVKYIVGDVYMPFLAKDEEERAKVYIDMRLPHRNYSSVRLQFNENMNIIKIQNKKNDSKI